jgi:hypothetical protein
MALKRRKLQTSIGFAPASNPLAIKYALVPQSKFCAVKPYFTVRLDTVNWLTG